MMMAMLCSQNGQHKLYSSNANATKALGKKEWSRYPWYREYFCTLFVTYYTK